MASAILTKERSASSEGKDSIDAVEGKRASFLDDVDPPRGYDARHHTLRLASTITVESEIICLAFSDDGRFLLAGCGDGVVRLFNPGTGALMSVLVSQGEAHGHKRGADREQPTEGQRSKRASSILNRIDMPCTCAAFRPHVKARERTSGVALIGFAHGDYQLWHVPSAKLLHCQHVSGGNAQITPREGEEDSDRRRSLGRHADDQHLEPLGVEVLCCAYAHDGTTFAVGASDGVLRVYDDTDKKLMAELKPGVARDGGHSSRIFSVTFHPDDPNTVISGGWDNCVHIWDVKEAASIRCIYGPHICGDAVDVVGNTILTASWRDDEQLETWDMGTGERLGSSFWGGHGKGPQLLQGAGRRCRLCAAAFGGPNGSKGKLIAAGGGGGANEVKVFASFEHQLVGSLLGLSAGVISLAFNDDGRCLAVGLADGQIYLLDIEATEVGPKSKGGKTIMVF